MICLIKILRFLCLWSVIFATFYITRYITPIFFKLENIEGKIMDFVLSIPFVLIGVLLYNFGFWKKWEQRVKEVNGKRAAPESKDKTN